MDSSFDHLNAMLDLIREKQEK
ncbi:uncharacterized protein G2W53_000711 [Senna tora]|uniref:Uncharacterized protein n=1 Tax=Senna tora TaxID=362788 RepID=A0A835CHY7_9FABA|nr:uncharacterized protein G2W53_000711 [Senna tora]